MKKWLLMVLACLLLCTTADARTKTPQYSLPTKGCEVLQNEAIRDIALPATAAIHNQIAGESPVTGQPWEGWYFPMLVQISNATDTVRWNGKNIKTAGVGKRAPWGLQFADIVYEECLTTIGNTRFAALFSDCFAQNQPALGVGPVRSARYGSLLLREEWQSGLVYGGGFLRSFGVTDETSNRFLEQTGVLDRGVLFHTASSQYRPMCYRVKGKKMPDNLNADILQMRQSVAETAMAAPRPFLFSQDAYTDGAYAQAGVIHLDWGLSDTISHFVYDSQTGTYGRYCGAGVNPARWAPFAALTTPEEMPGDTSEPLRYANLIVQRVAYEMDQGSAIRLMEQSVGRGNADIFLGGKYIPGVWVRPSVSEPTVFYDDQGQELQLRRGKTYIALLPGEALCAYGQEP